MRIGISVAQSGRLARPVVVSAAARAAEQLGYSSVWVCDSVLDPAGVLSSTAAITTRLRLGASLWLSARCEPAVLARSLATVDLLSDGRLSIALGLAAGCPEDRLEAVLDALDRRWAAGMGGEPLARSRAPVLLDGATPASLELLARRADGWSPSGLPVEHLAPGWAAIREAAAAQGRDPDRLQLVVRAGIVLRARPRAGRRASYEGDAEQVADDVEAVRRIGADEVVLRLTGDLSLDEVLDGYARIAEAAELRAAGAARIA